MSDINIPTIAIVLIVIVGILIIVGIYFRFFYHPIVDSSDFHSKNIYTSNYKWGPEQVTPGSTCRGYQFGIDMVSGTMRCGLSENDVEYLQMESPTFDSSILNNMESTEPFTCLDYDQLNAIEVTRVCNELVENIDPTTADKSKTWCPKADGTFAAYGESYTYYTRCTSNSRFGSNVTPVYCAGSIAGVSVGYQENGFTDLPCIEYIDGVLTINDCDLSRPGQQFRIIRTTDPTVHPTTSSNQGSAGNKGLYIAIKHRDTGLCLMPRTITNKPILGSDLVLRSCDDNNGGFVWALVPPMSYNVNPDGSFEPDSNLRATSPQQLVYIGAARNPQFNLNTTDSDQLGTYLTNYDENYTLSIYNDRGTPILGEYQTCGKATCTSGDLGRCVNCNNLKYQSEIATIILYNNLVARCS